MTRAEDFALTVGISLVGFCVACWLAWDSGRLLSRNERRGLLLIPTIFLFQAAWSACELQFPHFFGMTKYLSTQWMLEQQAGDCALLLLLAALSYVYAKVAPSIFAAGAQHHPRPPLAPTQIHERRRARAAADRRSIPFIVLGIGVWAIAVVKGYQMEDGELIAEAFIGITVWLFLVLFLADALTSKQFKKRGSYDQN